ncbi:hypothetical protein scyTo_0019145, partial [Scyliorhinus torazame]|nr:hypothetical protein [Scyliorhinus torazame]
SQKYKTEAESFGWSFVFEDFVSEELKTKVTQRIESAPWWLPIERAFWRQALDRLKRLGLLSLGKRGLRGGRTYPWGNKFQSNRTNLWQGKFPDQDTAEDGYHGVSPVNAFQPQNNYGLYDMLGNVWEWTDSEYSPPGLPVKADAQKMYVLRGSSWIDSTDGMFNHKARVTSRMGNTADSASDNLGFRCATSKIPSQQKQKGKIKTEL